MRSGIEIATDRDVNEKYANRYKNIGEDVRPAAGAFARAPARIRPRRGAGSRPPGVHREGFFRRLARRPRGRRGPQSAEFYAAFGNKEELYVRALRHYGGRNVAALHAILSRPGTIEARLGDVYRAAVDLYTAPPKATGCMIIGTATVEAPTHRRIAAAAAGLLAEIEAQFEQAFARAVAAGELAADPPPATRARLAGAILDTLAVRARLGAKAADLKAFARSTVPVICR